MTEPRILKTTSIADDLARASASFEASRRALVVLGMHRSGTSALAGVLGMLGATLPQHMGIPGPDNERGFWEPSSFVALNDEILAASGSSWDDVEPFPSSWFDSDMADAYVGRAVALIAEEYGDAALLVIKDPRMSRLLPFWRRVFVEAGIAPLLVHTVRNPLEVAASLKARNGFATSKSLLLWLTYSLESEAATRGRSRIFVSYEQLMHDWLGVAESIGNTLDVSWPRFSNLSKVEIDRFLSEQVRHHVYETHELAARDDVVGWVKRAYAALLDLMSDGGDTAEARATLDAIGREYADADRAFGPLLVDVQLSLNEERAAGEHLRAELARLEAQAADAAQAHAALAEERESLRAELEAQQAQAAQWEEERTHLVNVRERLVADLEQRRESATKQLDAAAEQLERLRAARDEALRAQQSLAAERDELASRADGHDALLAELESLRNAHDEAIAIADTLAGERDALLTDLEAARADAVARADTVREEMARVAEEGASPESLKKLEEERDDLIAQLEAQRYMHSEQVSALAAEMDGVGAELQHVRASNSALAADHEALLERLETERATHEEREEELGAQIQGLIEQAEQAIASAAALEQERDSLLSELEGERDRALASAESAAQEIERLQGIEVTSVEERSALIHERDALAAEVERLQIEAESAQRERAEIAADRDRMVGEIEQLNARATATAAEWEGVAADRERLFQEVERLQTEAAASLDEWAKVAADREHLFHEVERLRQEVAAATGERNSVAEERNRMVDEIAYLTERAAASLAEREQIAADRENLFHEVEQLRHEIVAAVAERDAALAEIENRAGDLEAQERLTEEHRRLTAEVEWLEQQAASMLSEQELLQSERDDLRLEVRRLGRLEDKTAELQARIGELEQSDVELTRVQIELENTRAELEAVNHALADAQLQLDERDASIITFQNAVDTADTQLDERAASIVNLQRAVDSSQTELEQSRAAIVNLESTVGAAHAELEVRTQEVAEVRTLLAEREVELSRARDDIQLEATRLAEELVTVRAELAGAEALVSQLRGELSEDLGQIARRDEELQELRQHAANLKYTLQLQQEDYERRRIRSRVRRVLHKVFFPILFVVGLVRGRVLSPWLRLRWRYAQQLLSWARRPTPTTFHWIRTYFALRHSGLFDYRYYIMRYPEVARARVNPLMHWIEFGAAEGRNPSERFDTAKYLELNPGLDPRRTNPLMHFLANGADAAESVVVAAPEPAEIASPELPGTAPRNAFAGEVDVFCLPIIDWHYRFQRPQQLATQFARAGHRVFYAETKFNGDQTEIQLDGIADNVWGIRLPGPRELIIYSDELGPRLVDELAAAFESFAAEAGVGAAVVVVDLPFWAPLAFELRRRLGWKVLYDCMDDHAGFFEEGKLASGVRDRLMANEDRLIRESDGVLATSLLLHKRIQGISPHELLLPNAADFEHFNRRPDTFPQSFEHMGRPVVGYYGAISAWFDVEMVETAAKERPSWTFVLVGSTFGADVSRLEALPNVLLLGEQPYADIPGYLHQFDVAMIPFKLVPLTEATNPVKFYEYLSAGKPVVSVPLPELAPYTDHYYEARTGLELVEQVQFACTEEPPDLTQKRIEFAKENTWESRFEQLQPFMRHWFGRTAIIIPSFDNPEYLELCLDSIWRKTSHPDIEVIVVENGSDKRITSMLDAEARRRPRLKVIRPDESLSFAAANNLAIQAAGDCEYVVLLNDDTIVTDRWLERLVGHLQRPDIGIVGPVTNWTGNEARIDVPYEGVDGLDEFAAKYTREHEGQIFDIGVLAMFCVAMRRELLEEIGMLDERYSVGMFEDDDFAIRVREAGLRVVCAEDAFVHHWGRASFSRMDQETYDRIFAENKARFEEKWGRPWVPHVARN
jgi:GT2 family glycosyltransferase